MKRALRDGVELTLVYDDDTAFGTVISGQLEERLKRHFRPLMSLLDSQPRETLEQAPALLESWLHDEPGGFYSAPGRLRPELARPDPRSARPAALRVDVPGRPSRQLALPAGLPEDLAARLSEWQQAAVRPARGAARGLWSALDEASAFGAPRPASVLSGPVTFVGHATVLLECGGVRILVDPFLLPREDHFPGGYQPLTHGDLAPDAILITHTHRDHFHLGSLLRLGRDTPIFVPEVPFESALCVDPVHRLKELGFTQARTLRWHDEAHVGACRIVALPFHGEQPTAERVLCPELRNHGNCWLVEGACAGALRRFAFVADAGRDHLGDVREVATAAMERHGPIDVLFGGYRSWAMYPIQYAASSVPQHLLLVPKALWGARQQIMNDADALLDTAERWGARSVVPYAAGGAPWYWQLDLGAPGDTAVRPKDTHFDPRPEAVLRAAVARSATGAGPLPSPVRVMLMRPGESLGFDSRDAATTLPNPGHLWPYREADAVSQTLGSLAEPVGLSRKRVLLRLLADAELKRRGQVIPTALVQEMSDDLRQQHGLLEHEPMLAWLKHAGLGMAEYCEILAEWQGVIRLEELMADEIERRLAGQRAFATMRHARQR